MSTVTLETTQHVVTLNTSTNEVVLDIVAAPVIIETTGGGLILASEIVTALNAANEPSATNPFATIADLDGSFPAQINVTRNWASAEQAYLDIVESLGVNWQQPISPSLLISVFFNTAGRTTISDHAVLRVTTTPPTVTYDYLVPFLDLGEIGTVAFVTSITPLQPLTESDLAHLLPMRVPVNSDWSSATNCLADIQTTLGWSFQPGGGTQNVILSLTRLTVGQSSSAALLVSMAGVLAIASYKVAWQAGVPEITEPPEEILLTAISNFDPALQAELTAHVMNHSAHGALTDSDIPAAITRDTELAASMLAEVNARTAAISAAVQGHVSEVDPHGDRAYTDTQIAAPHYARIFMMGV
jgi:hypothetical protein